MAGSHVGPFDFSANRCRYVCQRCGSEVALEAHHLAGVEDNSPEAGVALCGAVTGRSNAAMLARAGRSRKIAPGRGLSRPPARL